VILALIAAAGLLPLQAAPGKDSVDIHGRVERGAGAVISIPELRRGTVANNGGQFKIRLPPEERCYELLATTRNRERSVVRFTAPGTGHLDLGTIVPPRRRRREISIGVPDPLVVDTVYGCVPATGPWPERWPSGHARVRGTHTRGRRRLAGVPIDVYCAESSSSQRVTTDALGNFAAELILTFPDEQTLVERQAVYHIRHALVSIDRPLPVIIRFVPVEQPALVHDVDWALPEPDVELSSVVAAPGDINHPALLGNALGFRAGVFSTFQFVRLAIVPPPPEPTVTGRPDTTIGKYLLPFAFSVSTGHKLPSTGSNIFVNLPSEYAEQIAKGAQIEAYGRLRLADAPDANTYVSLPVLYTRPIGLLRVDLLESTFDDARSTLHEYEALVLLVLRPPRPDLPRY